MQIKRTTSKRRLLTVLWAVPLMAGVLMLVGQVPAAQAEVAPPPKPPVGTIVVPGDTCVTPEKVLGKVPPGKGLDKKERDKRAEKAKKQNKKYGTNFVGCQTGHLAKPKAVKKADNNIDHETNAGTKLADLQLSPYESYRLQNRLLDAKMKKSLNLAENLHLAAVGETSAAAAGATSAVTSALVLYDYQPNQQYGDLGHMYAIMLRNLLGHFAGMNVDLLPVGSYEAGQIETYGATFYIGSYYEHPLPAAFLADVAKVQAGQAPGATVVWFKNNLWKLAWEPSYNFTANTGLGFYGLVGLNAAPSSANPAPGFYDTVLYENLEFAKYYDYDPATGAVIADPDIGYIGIEDPNKASQAVAIANSATGQVIPYAVRAGNFWYVADIPFSFIGPRDRYLVFADILHDMVGSTQATAPTAMIRLEDVAAYVSFNAMKQITDYLQGKGIPFAIAGVPVYRDPLGIYNNGQPKEIRLGDADAKSLRDSLDYALQEKGGRGASLVCHGTSHQLGNLRNPYNGVTGNDFEFINIVTGEVPPELDTTQKVLARVDFGVNEWLNFGYQCFAWETPHYHASAVANRAFPERFDTTYQRVMYYSAEDSVSGRNAGQFFPYIIEKDYYGQRILPENLGNIEYDIRHIDPTSYINYTWEDLLVNARYALVVRDGYGSFFFHPFWLQPELGVPGFQDFRSLVEGMLALGYQFVDPSMQ